MSRLLVSLVVVLAVVGGALFMLAGRAQERPVAPIEQPVALGNLS